jgi:hypothetical protein
MLNNCGMDKENYDTTLLGWSVNKTRQKILH